MPRPSDIHAQLPSQRARVLFVIAETGKSLLIYYYGKVAPEISLCRALVMAYRGCGAANYSKWLCEGGRRSLENMFVARTTVEVSDSPFGTSCMHQCLVLGLALTVTLVCLPHRALHTNRAAVSHT